jgi:lysozyme family protein
VLTGICQEAGIDRRLPEILFDTGVMSGTETAARLLQRCLAGISGSRVAVDGIVGPETLACFRSVTASNRSDDLLAAFIRARLEFLDSLPNAAANPGWRARTMSFRTSAER